MISFDLTPHTARPGTRKVDVIRDGERVASIYPVPDGTLHIVSHLEIQTGPAPETMFDADDLNSLVVTFHG